MPIRPFAGVQTLVATSQPVFGTALSGDGSLAADPYTLKTGPGSNESQSVLPVTSVIGFLKNDRVLVGPKGGPYDQGSIFSIDSVGMTITVQGLKIAHKSAELLILNEDVSQVTIVPIALDTAMYLGNASTVSDVDPSVFDVIAPPVSPGQPTYWHNPPSFGGGAYKTSEYWVFGPEGGTFVARMHVL